MNEPPIRVLLVDDHRHIHEIVTAILAEISDIQLVGHASNGQEAILLCSEHQPDIVLMDIVMPVMNGLEATQVLQELHPKVKILVLSSYQDNDSVYGMLERGAVGYILKSALARDLVNTIRIIHSGNTVLSSEIAQVALQQGKLNQLKRTNQFKFTHRELEILQLMAQGLNNEAIARQLVISRSTVKFHISNVIEKMGVKTRAEAIVLAARNNLV
jgi:NarL family two-component system response regulator LiaR